MLSKKFFKGAHRIPRRFAGNLAVLALAAPTLASADTPSVTITSPTDGTTIFCTQFPCPTATQIAFEIVHTIDSLAQLVQLRVNVDGTQLLDVNPFTNTNLCTADLIAASTTCSTNAPTGTIATVQFPWVPEAPAQDITIIVSVRHSPNTDTDEVEQIDVVLASVEYPAPPAVANAFLNSSNQVDRRALKASVRGCVIAQIASLHAESYYGPKGGPYDTGLIQSDALAYYYSCL